MDPATAGLIRFTEKEGFKPTARNFVSVIEDTDFGRSVIDAVEKSMVDSGWKNLSREIVKIDQADYTAQMSKFKGLKPDVLFAVQTSVAAAASPSEDIQGIQDPRAFYGHLCCHQARIHPADRGRLKRGSLEQPHFNHPCIIERIHGLLQKKVQRRAAF